LNLPSLDAIRAEQERRRCEPNKYTGVAPLLVKINGKYQKIIPKLKPLYLALDLIDGETMPEIEKPKFIICVGGRSGGKSRGACHAFKEKAKQEKARFLFTREVQESIKDSVHKNLSNWIENDNDESEFKITYDSIKNIKTKADFIFKGMKSGTSNKTESIKSLEEIKYVMVEEAQTTSLASLIKMIDTIRVDGCLIVFCMNRNGEDDSVPLYLSTRKDCMVIDINYVDNPFLPKTMFTEAEHMKDFDYDQYLHTWMGRIKEQNSDNTILPAKWLKKCIDLHVRHDLNQDGVVSAGFDVADGMTTKHDKNCLAIRQGSVITNIEQWQKPTIYDSCEHVHGRYMDFGFTSVCFDVCGVGAGARGDFDIISRNSNGLPYKVIPFNGGSSPHGADSIYVSHGAVDQGKGNVVKNKAFFSNAKAQQWWNLRMRLENSMKIIQGKPVSRDDYYLSIDSSIQDIDLLIRELSQATYTEDASKRKKIDKAPAVDEETKRRSPNIADAIGYAFADDFKRGLRVAAKKDKIEREEYIVPEMSTMI
jgi:phage terminase large subunit